jgi:biotin-dependent carboxylase-like uncharacterized protein
MSTVLTIRKPGPQTTVQDLGRPRGRRFGIPLGGAADARRHRLALAVVGAPADAASLEFRLMGPTVVAEGGPVRVVIGGDAPGTITRAGGGTMALEPWRSVTIGPGDALAVGVLASDATGYLACFPPPDVPVVQGARGTMLRAQFGGHEGRVLAAGDTLSLADGSPGGGERTATPPERGEAVLRVIPGPQADHFDETAMATFTGEPFTVTDNADRMGVRLSGPRIAHNEKGADIMSEGLAPGAVQVPGEGQPIVLGVDAQTIGGYPKIATVITADLPRLAQLRPGEMLRFQAVSFEEARAALAAAEAALAKAIAGIVPAAPLGGLDTEALHRVNLLSGKVDARAPHHFPEALDE